MNKTLSVLKNVNFWGLLLYNLAVGEIIRILFRDYPFESVYIIFSYILVILVHFFLFKKINFTEKAIWKLLLYSFAIYTIISFPVWLIYCICVRKIEGIFLLVFTAIKGTFFIKPLFLLFVGVNFLWLLREKNKNKTTSILYGNSNFGWMLLCNLILFYVIREAGAGVFSINSLLSYFGILATLVFWFLFKKIDFTKAAIWKLALYSLLSYVLIYSLTWRIYALIFFDAGFEFSLSGILLDVFSTVFVSIKNHTLLTLLSSIVIFIGLYKEKYDRNKKNEADIIPIEIDAENTEQAKSEIIN